MSDTLLHPIRVVSRRTGLSPHVIRAWEKRYEAVLPVRTDTNRRLYTDEDIQRLQLLRRAIRQGRSIGQIARLPIGELEALVGEDASYSPPMSEKRRGKEKLDTPEAALRVCIDRVEDMDARGLEDTLARAAVNFTQPVVLEEIVWPLMDHVGERWQDGSLKIIHEHVATAIVRNFLGALAGSYGVHPAAPALVSATPAGQNHELGALSAAATAKSAGWRSVYAGPNLPAQEIAAAVEHHGATVVALSLVHPPDDPHVGEELRRLRSLISADVVVLAGGHAARSYGDVLSEIGAVLVPDLAAFREQLETLQLS